MLTQRLKLLRGKRTQEEIASNIGVSRARYSHYENGRSEPDTDVINKLADYFQVSVDYLLGRTDDPTPDTKETINTAFHDFDNLTDEEKEYLEVQLEIFRKIKEGKNK